jgi:hypothetical protein
MSSLAGGGAASSKGHGVGKAQPHRTEGGKAANEGLNPQSPSTSTLRSWEPDGELVAIYSVMHFRERPGDWLRRLN